ncbi:hypothetical protein [Clostridium thailandense]|uniref:hypothetical protein n=1 Tax=Clostridium thailandense TaxID=2794346 RepID=UPI003989EE0F
MSKNILDYFGERLICDVRDETIENWNLILSGKMKGVTANQVKEKISNFNQEQIEILKWVISKTIDSSLHNLLLMIDENDEIDVEIDNGETIDKIKEFSDGLCGELYTDDGWIKRFSKQKYDEI